LEDLIFYIVPMKKIGMILILLTAFPALAKTTAQDVLLSAIASCDVPNNPMINGLKELKGNKFDHLKLEVIGDMDEYSDAVAVTADVMFDPKVANSLSKAMVKKMGSIDIFIGRWSDGSTLGTIQKCDLKVNRSLR